MATPTYAQVISQINTFIVANGNNEITANVLNPILVLLTDFTNNTIGNLNDLTTDQKDTIVASINSLKNNFNNLTNNGVQLYTGMGDPNVTPPPTYKPADFFLQVDSDELPVNLWQYNGFVWASSSTGLWGGITGNIEDQTDLIDYIALKDAETLETAKIYVDGLLVGLLDDRGSYDASSNVFPSTGGSGAGGAILKGDLWFVSVAGTLGGTPVAVGDNFRALVDNPAQVASNWSILSSNIGYVPANDDDVIHKSGDEVKTGSLTANAFIKSGGLASQYLMADGSVSALTNPVTGTAIAGQVTFWGSQSSLAGDTEFLWDNVNKRLAIGQGVSSYPVRLAIAGNVAQYGGDSPTYTRYENNTSGLRIGIDDASGSETGVPYANFIFGHTPSAPTIFAVGGTERMRIAENTGNVLIGITNDASTVFKLQVNSPVLFFETTQPAYVNLRNNDGNFYLGKDNSAGTAFGSEPYANVIYGDSAVPTIFKVNGTERMRIQPNGNVGIATPSSEQPLDVNGVIQTRSSLLVGNLNVAGVRGMILGSTTDGSLPVIQGINSQVGPSDIIIQRDGGNVVIGGTNAIGKLTINNNPFVESSIVLNSIAGGGGSGSIQFYDNGVFKWNLATEPNNDFGLYNVGGAGAGYSFYVEKTTGNIGIGTPNIFYNSKLTVAGKIFLPYTGGSDIGGLIYGYNDTSISSYEGGLRFQTYKLTGGVSYVITDAVTINGQGNVGIGASPNGAWGASRKALQIGAFGTSLSSYEGGGGSTFLSHNAVFSNAGGFNSTYMLSAGATAQYMDGNIFIWANAPAGTAGNPITFTERMRLDANGNLGMGISIPLGKIHSRATSLYNNEGTSTLVLQGGTTTKILYAGYDETIDAAFFQSIQPGVGYKNIILNPISGNVAIGTVSPAVGNKLEVAGNVQATTYNGVKLYKALLSQVGTGAPSSFIVLANTLGGTPTWTRTGIGTYRLTLTGAWPAFKEIILISEGLGGNAYTIYSRISDNVIEFYTVDYNGTLMDDSWNATSLSIEVYP